MRPSAGEPPLPAREEPATDGPLKLGLALCPAPLPRLPTGAESGRRRGGPGEGLGGRRSPLGVVCPLPPAARPPPRAESPPCPHPRRVGGASSRGLEAGGEGSLFDALEGMDAEPCLAACARIAALNR